MKIETSAIIESYEKGQSINSIAKTFGTYPTSIKRVLEKNNIKLRHDSRKKGELYVQNGERLLKWAKAQDRLVTKSELAAVIGKSKLSPSYFIKYPELGQYIKTDMQYDLQDYYDKLYKWLQKNDILYKPNDRTKLKVSVDALLLGKYSNLAICIAEKPKSVSKKRYENNMKTKTERAEKAGITIIFLDKKSFKNLDEIKELLNTLKK